ncbi:alpha/beta fold hydrolase [Pseudonocardia broussonetiae]|uniref:Alpha/beta fold hydrolase n=1 Tax=Pseudonocardia broussonetiae TaxID=2736640 RepID=A0A6M6JQR3_9PSEU|nr:alpha/beta fold hydrolase [Pseudonocardia broussonetiae]QJY49620.1 alpha/beta fold hydrolase [Pseudonocardia broussonetiae]
MAAPLRHHRAALGDVDLHYVTAGEGDPVVLLHGWPQTWYCWRHLIPLLAPHHRVIAPDLRGLGESTGPARYDKRTLAGDVLRLVREELGIDRFHLVGHDWGGVTAFSLAAHHPDALATLTVVDVTVPGAGGTDIAQGGARWHHGLHRTPDLPEELVTGREEVYLGWFYRTFGHRPLPEEDVREYLRTYTRPDNLRAGFGLYRATPQDVADNTAVIARGPLRMPVLAVGGASGRGRGEEVADSLRLVAESVQGVLVEEAGHWVPEEQPEVLARHLLEFLRHPVRPRAGA